MKVRVLLAVSSIIFSSHALADYSAHGFHYMEMGLTQCKQIPESVLSHPKPNTTR